MYQIAQTRTHSIDVHNIIVTHSLFGVFLRIRIIGGRDMRQNRIFFAASFLSRFAQSISPIYRERDIQFQGIRL